MMSGVHLESSSMERAERIRATLSPEFPSFFKTLCSSHVSRSFIFNIPVKFCKELPDHDCTVDLVDENGQAYKAKYAAKYHILDVGWRRFCTAHKLVVGDTLVFHLIEPCMFKVYIVRAVEANGTHDLLSKCSHVKPIKTDESGSHNDNSFSDIQQSSEISVSLKKFKNVKNFEDFKIFVGDIIIDSEIPINIRKKYYELCCCQKMFIHDHLIEGLSCKLVGSMISETVNIVDAIRASNINTSRHQFKHWDNILSCFEGLCMLVGFLRTWISKLMKLNSEMEAIIESKREKRVRLDEEMRTLKKAKELMRSLEAEVVDLEVKREKLGVEFMELSGATKL